MTISKIAIDFDEVLFPMLPQLHKYAKKKLPTYTKKMKNEKYNYLFSDIFNLNEDDSKWLVHGYYNSNEAFETKPLKHSIESIKELSKKHKLYIVTGRQTYYSAKHNTEYLLNRYFNNCFEDILYSNSYSLNGTSYKKSELCNNLGITTIIDDSPEICIECENQNIEGVLFGDYPWTRSDSSIQTYLKDWNQLDL